jgi:predicted ATPase
MRRWTQAKSGDGSVVLISGEPCSSHHQDSALYPAIAQLERAAGFRRDDTSEQRLEKLEAVLLQATNDINEIAPLLADLLSIPTGSRYPTVDLTPQKRTLGQIQNGAESKHITSMTCAVCV